MKKLSYLFNVVLAIALVVLCVKLFHETSASKEGMDDGSGCAADSTWTKVDIAKAGIEPIGFFSNGAALTVGKEGDMNSMAIGWGQIGNIWGRERPVLTVYVRDSRHTKQFMDKYDTFTVETFGDEYTEVLYGYLGRVSGRDEDKIKGSGLTLRMTENGTPAFEEGNVIIECRKLSSQPMNLDRLDADIIEKWYAEGDDKGNMHTEYIGEIIGVWKRCPAQTDADR
ncbi:MAG: flavin reductase [Prevotella sp.]